MENKVLLNLREVKIFREDLVDLKEKFDEKFKAFEEENKVLIDKISNTKIGLNQAEEKLKEAAVSVYSETGEKKLDGGVGIRVMTKLEYVEENAFDWAKEHGLALMLDKRNFEKIAKTQDIEFVKKKEVAMATIPQKIEVD